MVDIEEFGSDSNETDTLTIEDTEIVFNVSKSDTPEFPILLIVGMEYDIELQYLKKLSGSETRPIDAFVLSNGIIKKICTIDLTHIFLLNLKCLGTYKLYLLSNKSDGTLVSYETPEDIIKFIA
jgi:hypothetical protein